MIYVYAVIEPARLPVPMMAGLECQPVEAAARAGIAAVFSRHSSGSIRPTARRAWEHEGVVETLMRGGAVVPARFGTCFATDEQLGECLATHADRLATGLKRVHGCVELGVRALQRPNAIAGPAPSTVQRAPTTDASGPVCRTGRDYMASLLARERHCREQQCRAARLSDSIHSQLAPLSQDSTRRLLPTPDLLMTAAYLVTSEEIAEFRAAVVQIGEQSMDIMLLCTGPWPPYHFSPDLSANLASPEAQNVS
jgi:hypothetical protein